VSLHLIHPNNEESDNEELTSISQLVQKYHG